jgi:hypothetical protein
MWSRSESLSDVHEGYGLTGLEPRILLLPVLSDLLIASLHCRAIFSIKSMPSCKCIRRRVRSWVPPHLSSKPIQKLSSLDRGRGIAATSIFIEPIRLATENVARHEGAHKVRLARRRSLIKADATIGRRGSKATRDLLENRGSTSCCHLPI